MDAEVKPRVVAALEIFDYPVRVQALRLVGSGDEISSVLDETIASPHLRQVLILLAHMAFSGLLEYYGGWDRESAGWTLSREALLAEELDHIEAVEWFNAQTGTEIDMKPEPATPRPHLAAPPETRVRQWDDVPPPRPTIPRGAIPNLAGLAELRRQERE